MHPRLLLPRLLAALWSVQIEHLRNADAGHRVSLFQLVSAPNVREIDRVKRGMLCLLHSFCWMTLCLALAQTVLTSIGHFHLRLLVAIAIQMLSQSESLRLRNISSTRMVAHSVLRAAHFSTYSPHSVVIDCTYTLWSLTRSKILIWSVKFLRLSLEIRLT